MTFAAVKPSHVKQHIYRTHQKLYCDVCLSLFDNIESREAHTRARLCLLANPVLPPGFISLQQSGELHRRIPAEHDTIESQWYCIFDIVCPGHPRPASPFNDFVVLSSAAQDSVLSIGVDETLAAELSDAQEPLTRILLQGFRQDSASFNQYEALLREGIARGLSSEAFSAWAATFRSGVQRTQSAIATGSVQHEPEHIGRPASSDSSEHAQRYFTNDLYPAAMQTAPFPVQTAAASALLPVATMGTFILPT